MCEEKKILREWEREGERKTIIFHFFRYLFYLQQSSGDEQYNWQGLLIYYSRFAWENGVIYIVYTRPGNNRLRRRRRAAAVFDVCRWKMIITKPLQTVSFVMWPPTANKINTRVTRGGWYYILLLSLLLLHYNYMQRYVSLLQWKRKNVSVCTHRTVASVLTPYDYIITEWNMLLRWWWSRGAGYRYRRDIVFHHVTRSESLVEN